LELAELVDSPEATLTLKNDATIAGIITSLAYEANKLSEIEEHHKLYREI
jgi:hypothetical protein